MSAHSDMPDQWSQKEARLALRLLRDQWFGTPQGEFAGRYIQHLLWSLLSGWQRRGRSMLVVNAGSGPFALALWELGFDVTAQDESPLFLEAARSSLGSRADYLLAVPEHLPCDDLEYDYSVAVCAPEVWGDVQKALHELRRVSAVGVILIFTSTLSLNRLYDLAARRLAGGRLCCEKKDAGEGSDQAPVLEKTPAGEAPNGPECTQAAPRPEAHPKPAIGHPVISPFRMRSMVATAFPGCRRTWRSCLLGPAGMWRDLPLMSWRGSVPSLPVPCGAVCGLRIDANPAFSGTPLLLRTGETAKSGIMG